MKKILLVAGLLFLLPTTNYSQILNASFENWTDGEPDNWATSNDSSQHFANVTASSDAHSGLFSARGEVKDYFSTAYSPLLGNTTVSFAGSAVDHRIVSLTMWLKFHPDSEDVLMISTSLTKQSTTTVGAILVRIPNEAAEWSQLILPYTYYDKLTVPDTMTVALTINGKSGPNPHLGSWFEIDDLAYSDEQAGIPLQEAGSFGVKIFPNPVTDQSVIDLSITERTVISAGVFDITGREVRHLISNTYPQGVYRIPFSREGLTNGIYYLRVTAGANATVTSIAVTD